MAAELYQIAARRPRAAPDASSKVDVETFEGRHAVGTTRLARGDVKVSPGTPPLIAQSAQLTIFWILPIMPPIPVLPPPWERDPAFFSRARGDPVCLGGIMKRLSMVLALAVWTAGIRLVRFVFC